MARRRAVVMSQDAGLDQRLFGSQSSLAADPVDGAMTGCGDEPGRGSARHPVPRPSLSGCGKRVLRGFLGEIEVAEEADERSENAAPLVAEDPLEDG